MAVAAAFGGVSPNFDPLYKEVSRLSRTLSIATPREINNPGETLKLTMRDLNNPNSQPQTFDIFMRPFYNKEGDKISYDMFYKDGNNNEKQVTRSIYTGTPPVLSNQVVALNTTNVTEYSINGQVIDGSLNPGTEADQLIVDINSGRIVFKPAVSGGFDARSDVYMPGDTLNKDLGVVKFDGATGLDVGLINDRISQLNLTIEALNKVLLVAASNIDKGLTELR